VTITVHPFKVQCPVDYNVTVDAGTCAAIIATDDPIFDCPPITQTWTMSGATTGSGNGNVGTATFNVGTTVVTYDAEDAMGNTTSCSFNVTVTDDEAPVVSNCPADVTVSMDAGLCGAIVNFTDPTFTDNCDGNIAPVRTDGSGFNSGDQFSVGTTTISYSATDAAGNTSTCSFDITVLPDSEAPVINCVADQAECANANSSYTISGTAWNATATDNCVGAITLSYSLSGVTTGTGTSLNNANLNVGTTTVTWTATDINGNFSSCSFDVVVTEAPAITTDPVTQSVCLNGSVTFTAAASGTPAPTFQWRKNGVNIPAETASTYTINPVLSSDAANYDVVVTNSCGSATSTPATLTVSTPPIITAQPANQTDCIGGSVLFTVTAANGETPYSYSWEALRPAGAWTDAATVPNITFPVDGQMLVSNIGDANNPDQTQYKVTVTDDCGNTIESAVATLTVNQMVIQPLVSTTVCQGGSITFTVATSGTSPVSYEWQLDGITISDGGPYSGATTQTLTIVNAMVSENGTYSARAIFNITQPNNNGAGVTTCEGTFIDVGELIVDEGPDIVATPNAQTICPGSVITQMDLSNANGTPGTTYSWTRDNTTVLTGISASGTGNTITGVLNSLDPGNVQTTTFTITATANGCVSTSTATVTVVDQIMPTVALCTGDVSVNTDANSCDAVVNYTLPTFDDNCDGNGLTGTLVAGTASGGTFPVGTTTVTYEYTDAAGNGPVSCSFDVTVTDNEDPTALCQNITVQLGATGNVSISESDIDNGSYDACGIAGMILDITSFDCTNVGNNTVTLIVTDNNGNTATCTSTVTVEDNTNPTAVCRNITVQLDATGNANIVAADVDNGSSDICGIASMSVSPNSFNCTDVGDNTVTLTVTDNNGNTSTCTSTVTIEDNINPTALCKDITVQLDATGNATIIAADIDNGSSDNCGIASMSVSPSSFDCTGTGNNTVTLTVTDDNGNTSTCTSTVTVEDNVSPTAVCQDITVQLDAAGVATITANDIDNGSSDNCAIANLSIDINSFNCTNLGDNTVTLTFTDNSGNTSTCTSTVRVRDDNFPVTITANVFYLPIECYGETTTVTITTSGGVPPLSYTFDGVTNLTGIFNNVSAANGVAWSVTDPLGCSTASGTIDVTQPVELSATIASTDVTCTRGNDGSITVSSPLGGSGSYEFTIDGGT
ncbi:HYR domain-containing protein, partial [Draconibacterium sp.]|nr:HYR domain-containing protein [Draconibacterium sp.]